MKIYLANPRGFCAGVDRAIDIVDLSLKKYGAPIYVRHEIVHSRHVVNSLRQKGAVFVEELSEVPEGSVVIFSARRRSKTASRTLTSAVSVSCASVRASFTEPLRVPRWWRGRLQEMASGRYPLSRSLISTK